LTETRAGCCGLLVDDAWGLTSLVTGVLLLLVEAARAVELLLLLLLLLLVVVAAGGVRLVLLLAAQVLPAPVVDVLGGTASPLSSL